MSAVTGTNAGSNQSINPNINMTTTDTVQNGKIELNSGSGPVTFDELEQVTKEAKKSKSKAKESDDKPEGKAEKSIDLSSDSDKGKKSEAKPKSESNTKDAKPEATEQAKTQEQIRKLIKAKYNDQETDLDEEALVPVKINGKEEMVQIKELLGNYSGKTAWDKKFTELSKQKKDLSGYDLKIREAGNQIKDILNEQDASIRMFKMAKLAGIDPVQYRQQFLDENLNYLEKYYGMSEDERKADALAYEAKFHKHRADTLEGSVKQEHSQRELSAKLENLRASHQVSEDEFVDAYDKVSQLAESGVFNKSQVNSEFIIEMVNKDRLYSAAEAKIDQLSLPWDTKLKGKKIMDFVDNAYQLGLKPKDMAYIVDEVWGDKKTQKKAEQIASERKEFMTGKKDVAQNKAKPEQALFFDEIL